MSAWEKFYGEQPGSSDVLYSKEGPICDVDEQILGNKVFLIKFFQPSAATTKKQLTSNYILHKYIFISRRFKQI